MYAQYYWNDLTKPAVDTRTWKQNYSGTLYKSGLDNLYSYTVTINYTTYDAPGTITGLTATALPTSVNLTWNPVTGASGYEVRVTGPGLNNQLCSSSGTSGSCGGLAPLTSYTFTVKAINSYGNSTASIVVTTTSVPGGGTGGGTGGSWVIPNTIQISGTTPQEISLLSKINSINVRINNSSAQNYFDAATQQNKVLPEYNTIPKIISALTWNHYKIGRLWEASEEISIQHGTTIDPRMMLAVMRYRVDPITTEVYDFDKKYVYGNLLGL